MEVMITAAYLGLLTAAILVLRIFWLRFPAGLRRFLLRAAVAAILLHVFFVVTKWGTTSTRMNAIVNWLAIAGYELLVLLFSRLSPKWLTSLSATILLIPLLASSIIYPLTLVLVPDSIPRVPMGNHLFYKSVAWGNSGTNNSGVDLNIYYSPPFLPFLMRKVQSQPFNTEECNAFAALALPGPEPRTVLARCPHWPAQPPGNDDKVLRLH
jgi:hypothetical protein